MDRQAQNALTSEALKNHPDYRPLTLFPGIELSVHGGVHLLALFDPSQGTAQVEALRGAVGYHGAPGESDAVTEDSLGTCIDEVIKHNAIPIPAHVDGPKGFLCEVTDHNTFQQALAKLTAAQVCSVNSQIFKQRGNLLKGLSLVAGSDSHAPGEIGTYAWIKMTRPDIEGLRLALLDSGLAVRLPNKGDANPNQVATQHITELWIENLKLRRNGGLSIRFNPWFNTIIGGRGSGKSTLLECLRIGLNRTDELDAFEDLNQQFQRFRKISAGRNEDGVFLKDSEITVEYLKDGLRHRMRWRANEPAPVLLERDGADWREAGQVAPSRFPARIYSQKQVFEMAKNPHSLRRLMDEDPGLDKPGWQRRWDELETRFLNLRAEHRRLSKELAERERIEGELRDVQRKLRVFEQSHHTEVFKAYQRSQRQQTLVDRYLHGLEERIATWQATLDDKEDADFGFDPQGRFDQGNPKKNLLAIFENLEQGLSAEYQQLHTSLDKMKQQLQGARISVNASVWQVAAQNHRKAYERLKTELAQQGIVDPNIYGQLVQQQQVHETRLKELESKQVRHGQLRKEYETTYEEIKTWRLELTQRRRKFVDRVLDQKGHVRVELQPFGDRKQAKESIRTLIDRQNVYAEYIGENDNRGFIHDLYVNQDRKGDSDNMLNGIDTLKSELDTSDIDRTLIPTIHTPFLNHLKTIGQKTPEVLDRLWCWFPEDEVQVRYRTPSGKFSSIDHASAGQKTSAILSFLLAYGEEPLILDQPEDDLDNALIYELIVKQIRENKARRQIIVVTHNPNIVVHGDAEWVLPLRIHKGGIEADRSGGLQEINVRQAVCDIMEGGVEAFERRYRKIHDPITSNS